MKQREGFISNSSSSSFIIAYKVKEEGVCPHCNRPYESVIDEIIEKGKPFGFFNPNCDVSKQYTIDTLKDCMHDLRYDRDGCLFNYYKGLLKKIENYEGNLAFAEVRISTEDDETRDMLDTDNRIIAAFIPWEDY